jgi:hypothetical protein
MNAAECGETLTVGVSSAAEVKLGLVSDTDKESDRAARPKLSASQRNRAIQVTKSGLPGALMRDWPQTFRPIGHPSLEH